MKASAYPGIDVRHAPGTTTDTLCGRKIRAGFSYKISPPSEIAKPSWKAIGCRACIRLLEKPPRTTKRAPMAQVVVLTFALQCKCGATIDDGCGQASWPQEREIACPECGQTSRVPHKAINRLWGGG